MTHFDKSPLQKSNKNYLQLKQNSPSFCAAYECNKEIDGTSKGWGYGFEACVCPKKFENEKPENNNFTPCCTYGLTVHKGSKLICPQEDNKGTNMHCKNSI